MAQPSSNSTSIKSDAIRAEASLVDEDFVREHTYVIRGQKVMLDRDLAAIYGYETRRFNEQVKNNIEKFEGDDFMFQLTGEEAKNLMSKKSTSNWGGTRKLPYAFTEQGIYMLMTVLKGDLAIKQSRALIRTFKKMKDYIIDHQSLLGEREYLKLSLSVADSFREIMELNARHRELDDKVANVVDQLGQMITKSDISQIMMDFGNEFIRYGYGLFNGHFSLGDIVYEELYETAKYSIVVVDNYISLKTLVLMAHAREGVKLTVISDNLRKGLHQLEYEDFLKDYPNRHVEFRRTMGRVHDRFMLIDYGTDAECIYHCGGSSKDAGMRATAILRLFDTELWHGFFDELLANPRLELA